MGGNMRNQMRLASIPAISLSVGLLFVSAGYAAEAGPAPGETLSQSYRESQRNNLEYQMVEPFQVFDNLYYVGPGFVSVWLLETSEGLILFDAAEEPYVEHILAGIRSFGFDPADIEYIIISHGHLDHFGGVPYIQDISGARVAAMAEDWEMIAEVGTRPGRNNGPSPRVPERDMALTQNQTIVLGEATLTIHHTPGHTPGVTSTEFYVYDNGRPYRALLVGGSGARNNEFEDALYTSRLFGAMDIDVAVMNHSWLGESTFPRGGIFERAQLLATRKPGDPHPFVDPDSWREWVEAGRERSAAGLEALEANGG
nr:MAG: MBL fold metallo-hydrolase [Hyphomicrobiales bacterium]